MEMPSVGSTIAIRSTKHDGLLHRCWEENTILYQDSTIVVGYNDHTLVHEHNKTPWRTEEPAMFYFDCRYWFNIIYLLSNNPLFYCNISAPFTYANGVLNYIDYDLDVLVQPSGRFEIIDQEEYEENCQYYNYPQRVQEKITIGLNQLINWITTNEGPFKSETMKYYHTLYMRKRSK